MRITAATLVALALAPVAAAAQRPVLPRNADPNDWEAYYDAGVAAINHDPAEADALFAYAARLDPSRAEPLYGRWAAFHLRDVRRFQQYLDEREEVVHNPAVVRADSFQLAALARNPFVHRGLSAVLFDALPGAWGDDQRTRAFLAYSGGRLREAVRDFDRIVARDPKDVDARYEYALALVAARQFAPAREQLDSALAVLRRREARRVVKVYASKEMLEYSIGLLYLEEHRTAEARETMANAVLENAAAWYAHRGLAEALTEGGLAGEAIPEYRTALELAGDEPLLLYEYAVALTDAGQIDEAAAQLRKAVALGPEWAEAWLALGNAALASHHPRDAAAAYNEFIARAPRRDAARVEQARGVVARNGGAAP